MAEGRHERHRMPGQCSTDRRPAAAWSCTLVTAEAAWAANLIRQLKSGYLTSTSMRIVLQSGSLKSYETLFSASIAVLWDIQEQLCAIYLQVSDVEDTLSHVQNSVVVTFEAGGRLRYAAT